MTIKKPVVDYRKLRLGKLNTDEFAHLKLLLYWPVFGLLFLFVERFYKVDHYYSMHCALDDVIPFQELFFIPYLFWFVYLVGMHLYTLFYDIDAFKKMMKYIMITYSVAILIYFIFPTCQELRPLEFERNNILTRTIAGFYQFDTNTNVCPSIHVIGSLAVLSAALHSNTIRSKGLKVAFTISAILICISIVFMKQHSVLDLFAALPVCIVADFVCYKRNSPDAGKYNCKTPAAGI